MRAFKGSSEITDDLRTLERARTVVPSSLNPASVLAQAKKPITLPKAFQPKQAPLAKGQRRQR